jgi:hypothetical protein
MPDPQIQDLIDGIRARIQAELEAQLTAIASTHAHAVEQVRHAAEAEAESRWSSRLETTRSELASRLDADVAAARAEAEQRWQSRIDATRAEWSNRLEAEVANARAEAERRLVAESMKVRVEAEQSAAEVAGLARRQMEEALASERAQAQARLDLERTQAQARLEEERQRADAEAAERRAQAEAAAAERQQAHAQIDLERQKVERELEQARAALETERQRMQQAVQPAHDRGSDLDGARLLDAMRSLDAAGSLSDVLALTAAAAAVEAPRSAVFVANGPQLEEWTVPELTTLSTAPIRIAGAESGVLGAAMTHGEPQTTGRNGGQPAPAFAALPAGRVALAVPLTLGAQAVGVLYADEGRDGQVHGAWRDAIQILGRHASACLAFLTAARTAQAMRLTTDRGPAPARTVERAAAEEDQGARRYARLLVSEIKLYNEAAVRVGREKRDLGRRLKPEIERARRLYDERIPASVAGRDACFEQELVQTLADGDSALLG